MERSVEVELALADPGIGGPDGPPTDRKCVLVLAARISMRRLNLQLLASFV